MRSPSSATPIGISSGASSVGDGSLVLAIARCRLDSSSRAVVPMRLVTVWWQRGLELGAASFLNGAGVTQFP
jgi:hypothetical protein